MCYFGMPCAALAKIYTATRSFDAYANSLSKSSNSKDLRFHHLDIPIEGW